MSQSKQIEPEVEQLLGIKPTELEPETSELLNLNVPKVNPAGDYYKYQLSEMLRKYEEEQAPKPAPQPTPTPPSVMGVPTSAFYGQPQPLDQPKQEEGKSLIWTPIVDIGGAIKKQVEMEKAAGGRIIAGPRGIGVRRVAPTGPIQSGIRVAVGNLMNTFTSPGGLALAATPALRIVGILSPALKFGIEAGFTYKMAEGFVLNSRDAVKAFERGDFEEFGRLATEAIGEGLFAFFTSKNIYREAKPWYDALRSAYNRRPPAPGDITEVGTREPQPPPMPPELTGPPEVAMQRAQEKIAQIKKLETEYQTKRAAEKLAAKKAKEGPTVFPEWPPKTPEAQAAAERAFEAAMPKKTELIEALQKDIDRLTAEGKWTPENFPFLAARPAPQVEPPKEGTIATGPFEGVEKPVVAPPTEPTPTPAPSVPTQPTPRPSRVEQNRLKRVQEELAKGKDLQQIAYRLNLRESEIVALAKQLGTDLTKAKEKVVPKIETTPAAPKEEPLALTMPQYEAIAKDLGVEFEDLTEAAIKKYVAEKGVPEGVTEPLEERTIPELPDVTDEEIEAHYGKPLEKLTEDEIEAYWKLRGFTETEGELKEPVNEVDMQTGAKGPVEPLDVDEPLTPPEASGESGTVFLFDRKGTQEQAKAYARNNAVANSIDELRAPNRNQPKYPDVTVWKLINDVNRWRYDEEIDIEHTRDFLSEVAARADEFKWAFKGEAGYPANFNEWKELAQEAAVWARHTSRPDKGVSVTRGLMNNLNLFVDPTKIPGMVREVFKRFLGADPTLGTLPTDDLFSIQKKTGFTLNPYDKRWKYEPDDSKMVVKIDLNRIIKDRENLLLSQVIDYPEFFTAYPEAANIKIEPVGGLFNWNTAGQLLFEDNTIQIGSASKDPRGTLLHELQHWVQETEGYAKGGNVETAIKLASREQLDKYTKIATEELSKRIDISERHLATLEKDRDVLARALWLPQIPNIISRYQALDLALDAARGKFYKENPGAASGGFGATSEYTYFARERSKLLDEFATVVGLGKFEAIPIVSKITVAAEMAKRDPKLKFSDNVVDNAIAGVNRDIQHDNTRLIELRTRLAKLTSPTSIEELRSELSNVSSASFNIYRSLAGEIEARDVTARQYLSEEARRVTPPFSSEQWDPKDVIVHFNKPGSSGSKQEIVDRLRRIHPAPYPKHIQKIFADIANTLGITDVLDIFAGVGNIGRLKEYGYTGKIRTSEIEPSWMGKSTKELHKERGVDEVNVGDSRKLLYPDNSIQAIMTSPTYGNLMALRSASKLDSYQAMVGRQLKEGNTGGEVWGPEYEKLHEEVYDEAYRVVKPGGYFVLNMKDKPVNAVDAKNNWIPKAGSTVEVVDNVMKATDWHIYALEEAGFELIDRIKVPEARPISAHHAKLREKTVGYEEIVVLQKPGRTVSSENIPKEAGGPTLYSGIDPFKIYNEVKLWYSGLRKLAQEKLPNRAPTEQVLNTLKKYSTVDEWINVGLDNTLPKGKMVTKEEVLREIDKKTPTFKDVLLEGSPSQTDIEIMESEAATPERMEPQYSSYVEPGGRNYKELFVTAPAKRGAIVAPTKEQFAAARPWLDEGTIEDLWQDILSGKRKPIELDEETPLTQVWRDGHPSYSDIENPIVRLRFNERNTLEGEKVLFIEEMQSPVESEQAKMPPEYRKRWREIGMKRAIKWAVDNGFDRVAWTTGEMQAKRYTIGDRFDKVIVWQSPSGGYSFSAESPGRVYERNGLAEKELAEYIGEDLALQAVKDIGDTTKIVAYTGQALFLGGQGLRKLYNQDLPSVAKKLGAKVENIDIPMKTKREYDPLAETEEEGIYNLKEEPVSVPSFSISPLKERAAEGFTFYTGIDPTPLVDKIRNIFNRTRPEGGEGPSEPPTTQGEYDTLLDNFNKSFEKTEKAKRFNARQAAKDLRENLAKDWLHQSGTLRRKLENYGDEGYKLMQVMALHKGAHPHATNMLRQARNEMHRGLSNPEKQVLKKLIHAERILSIALSPSGRRFQYPEGKSPTECALFTELFAQKKYNKVVDLSPERAAAVKRAATIHFDWIKKAVRDLHKAGLIGDQELEDLLTYNYQKLSPVDRTIARLFDKRREVSIGGKKVNVYDSGIETLASGKKTDVLDDDYNILMLETFNRIYNRVFSNEPNKVLMDLARKDPENPFVRVKEPEIEVLDYKPTSRGKLTDSIKIKRLAKGLSDYEFRKLIRDKFKRGKVDKLSVEQLKELDASLGEQTYGYVRGTSPRIPSGWKRHFVYENGARKIIWLEPSFSDQWLTSDPEISSKMATYLRWGSFTPLVRAFATGVNPTFALRNLPRDMTHAWGASKIYDGGKYKGVYSAVLPKFIYQIGNDYKQVFKDALFRRGSYNDMMEDGGGMDFLTIQARPFRRGLKLESTFDKIYDFFSYLNETSEIATRLAIRNRVIRRRAKELEVSKAEAAKNEVVRKEATFAALDQMNYHEGGGISKTLDNALPYFNARVVATRSFWRNAKGDTGPEFWLKIAQFAGVVTALYILNQLRSPETMEALKNDNRAKGNLVLPLGDSLKFTDKDGETRYPFIVIPIDQGQRFLKAFFEGVVDKMTGRPVDAVGLVKTLKDSAPVDIGALPPSFAAWLGYATNTDFWLSEDVWRSTEAFGYQLPKALTGKPIGGSEEEYIPGRTPEWLVTLGAGTGLSPERLKYGLEQIITRDNMYSNMFGSLYDHTFGTLPQSEREETLAEMLSKVPVIEGLFKITSPRSAHRVEIEEGREESIIKNFVENRGLDALANGFLHGKTHTEKEVLDYINKDPMTKQLREKADFDRLKDRFEFHERIADIPSRGFWLQLKGISDPEGRAKTYVKILRQASERERAKILKEEDEVYAIDRRGVPGFRIFSESFKRALMELEQVKYPGIK